MNFEEGTVVFKGCCWDAKWDFDYPIALYEPVKRYGLSDRLQADSFRVLVVDVCEELCAEGKVRGGFTKFATKVFEENKWTFNLKAKKSALHGEATVLFYLDRGVRRYEILD